MSEEKALRDYFATQEFRLRHAKQHLETIRKALNALEKEGWELKDGEFTLSSAIAMPFGHNEQQNMTGLPDQLTLYWDNTTDEWRSDTP